MLEKDAYLVRSLQVELQSGEKESRTLKEQVNFITNHISTHLSSHSKEILHKRFNTPHIHQFVCMKRSPKDIHICHVGSPSQQPKFL